MHIDSAPRPDLYLVLDQLFPRISPTSCIDRCILRGIRVSFSLRVGSIEVARVPFNFERTRR